MNDLRFLFSEVAAGRLTVEAALHRMAEAGERGDSGDLVLDLGREHRTGFPEAVFGAGKTPVQTVRAFTTLRQRCGRALATRCPPETVAALAAAHPDVIRFDTAGLVYAHDGIVGTASAGPGIAAAGGDGEPTTRPAPAATIGGRVAVVAAGTSDLAVADEAAGTLEFAGATVERVIDVGVAGIHRLIDRLATIRAADLAVVIAGMEGALPSVIGGLVATPIIAVPTSIGYGASLGGLTALLAMLNSCAPGIVVVNIDNGFGAAVAAIRILRARQR